MSETRSLASFRTTPFGTGVEGWLAVDDELVTVMAVMEVDLGAPRAVDLAVHKVLA